MKFDLNEKDIIYVLNCMNYCMRKLTYHTYDEKKELSKYFNFKNYDLYIQNMINLHRRLSLTANEEVYRRKNNVFFIGQRDYLISAEKDFQILKNKSRYKIEFEEKNNFQIRNIFYLKKQFSFFHKNLDKIKKIL